LDAASIAAGGDDMTDIIIPVLCAVAGILWCRHEIAGLSNRIDMVIIVQQSMERRPVAGWRSRATYVHLTAAVERLKSCDLWEEAECVWGIREELFPRSHEKLDGKRGFSNTFGEKR
jgi:hypothetical protein